MKNFAEYFLGVIILAGFVVIVYLTNKDKKVQQTSDNMARIELLQHSIDSLFLKKDSVSIIENNLTKKVTIINNYYDSIKTVLYVLPDSVQLHIFWANLARFDSVHFSAPSTFN